MNKSSYYSVINPLSFIFKSYNDILYCRRLYEEGFPLIDKWTYNDYIFLHYLKVIIYF